MECGIEFVSTRDKYFEGFEKAEVEEDEEELKVRGGIGYRQFYEADPADGYDAADLDGGGGDDGDGDGGSLDDLGITVAVAPPPPPPNGAVTRSASGLGIGADRVRGRGGAAAGDAGAGAPAVPVPVPEEERRFDRREMLRKESTRGREAVARERDGSDDSSSEASGLGEEAVNDYTGFDTASESSSMFSAGGEGGRGWSRKRE